MLDLFTLLPDIVYLGNNYFCRLIFRYSQKTWKFKSIYISKIGSLGSLENIRLKSKSCEFWALYYLFQQFTLVNFIKILIVWFLWLNMFTSCTKTSTAQPVMSPNVPRISWQNICTNCHLSAKNFSKETPRNRRRSCEIHDLEWKTSTMYTIISDGWLICILEGVSIWIWICFLLLSNLETFHIF